jgi:hypothetical protein
MNPRHTISKKETNRTNTMDKQEDRGKNQAYIQKRRQGNIANTAK